MQFQEYKQLTKEEIKKIQKHLIPLWKNSIEALYQSKALKSFESNFETYPYYKRQLHQEIHIINEEFDAIRKSISAIDVSCSTIVGMLAVDPEEATHKLLGEK
jgi:hypothetical protein